MKYRGTLENLQTILNAQYQTTTKELAKNKYQIKILDGATLTWFQSTGTIQIQGKPDLQQEFEHKLCQLLDEKKNTKSPPRADAPSESKVFIVHEHDSIAREQLELILHKLGLKPYVLQNDSGDGLTIIEALERGISQQKNAAKFGIVLLTPDDMGYAKQDGEVKARSRARQNVILEMGMLISALGRSNVAVLIKKELEFPSDIAGILYIPFNDHVKEAVPKLVNHLNNAGFDINSKAITSASS